MKKRAIQIVAVALVLVMCLGGCGEALIEMTDSEYDMVVKSAAYMVAKHNTYQKDGLRKINESLIAEETESEENTENTESENEPSQGGSTPDTPSQGMTNPDAVALTDALGYSGQLSITYTGVTVAENFQEGKVYSVDAKPGNCFVVLSFSAKNVSDASLEVDMFAKQPGFSVCLDGETWNAQEVTLLLSDLSTYQGTLSAGEEKELVLLFQVSAEKAAAISDVSLTITVDGEKKSIIL